MLSYNRTSRPLFVRFNFILFPVHFSQDASVLDQVEKDVLAEFQSMRMPAPKVSKISDLIPVLNLPIPSHLINTVSHTYNRWGSRCWEIAFFWSQLSYDTNKSAAHFCKGFEN